VPVLNTFRGNYHHEDAMVRLEDQQVHAYTKNQRHPELRRQHIMRLMRNTEPLLVSTCAEASYSAEAVDVLKANKQNVEKLKHKQWIS
jgi:hypothetical protein